MNENLYNWFMDLKIFIRKSRLHNLKNKTWMNIFLNEELSNAIYNPPRLSVYEKIKNIFK